MNLLYQCSVVMSIAKKLQFDKMSLALFHKYDITLHYESAQSFVGNSGLDNGAYINK